MQRLKALKPPKLRGKAAYPHRGKTAFVNLGGLRGHKTTS